MHDSLTRSRCRLALIQEEFRLGVNELGLRPNPEQLARKLIALEKTPGFMRAVCLGPDGELLAGYPGGPEENKKYGERLRKIFEAAVDCSLRMDISTFEKGMFESEDGLTYLVMADRLQLAALYNTKGKKAKVQEDVHRFVEHDLYL